MTARESLNRLSGEGVDRQIVRLIDETRDPEVRVELIRAAGNRRTASAAAALMKVLGSDDRRVTQAALKALAVVGRVQDVPTLIRRLSTSTRMQTDLEEALVGIAEQHDIKDDVVDRLLALTNDSSAEVRRSILRLLARLGGDKGLAFVEQCLESDNDAVSTEAARALSNWPTRAAMALARRTAETDENPIHRILALRGYIQMAVLPSDETPQEVFNTLRQAMDLAVRDDERWLVLSAMTQAPCRQSLAFVQAQLDNATLAAEAQSAVLSICRVLIDSEPVLVREALNRVLDGDPNRMIRREARFILRRL